MPLTLEQVIFIALAVVAIFSAAFMLISRNAVHSALFLVVNFLCVALFYLMLNAPFLAMIQITVYAGAIMVLFMFVIMLLGAERLGGGNPRFGWLAPTAVLLVAALLVTAGVAIWQGNVGALKPVPHDPQLRVVHAIEGAPAVDVFLNDTKALDTVAPEKSTAFGKVLPGQYEVKVFPACTEADASKCADPIESKASPLFTTTLNLAAETATTVVLAGSEGATPKAIVVPTDLSTLANEETFRLQAVNALPSGDLTLFRVDPTKDENPDNHLRGETLIGTLPAGTALDPTQTLILPKGSYDLVWLRGNERFAPVNAFRAQPKQSELLVVSGSVDANGTIRPTVIRVEPARTAESFGSPQAMGYEMLGNYLLPFELVSLLLLAALVGAIILTREEVTRRVRDRVKVSGMASGLNRAIAEGKANQSGAESSAD